MTPHAHDPGTGIESLLTDVCGKTPPADLLPSEESVPQSEHTQRDCYLLILPELRMVLPEQMVRYGGRHDLVHYNANRGTRSLARHLPELSKRFTADELRLAFQVPILAAALIYTARRVERLERTPTPLDSMLPEMWKCRSMMMAQMTAAAKFGFIEQQEIKRIGSGYGVLNGAQGLTDLAALYRENEEALAGRTFITEEFLDKIERLSAQVRLHIIPKGGTAAAGEPTSESSSLTAAIDERDRVWTLLVNAHAMGQRMAGSIWGARVQQHYPSLRSSSPRRRTSLTESGHEEASLPPTNEAESADTGEVEAG